MYLVPGCWVVEGEVSVEAQAQLTGSSARYSRLTGSNWENALVYCTLYSTVNCVGQF